MLTARFIYAVLSKQAFRNFYEGMFAEHLEDSSERTGVTKNAVLTRLTELFRFDDPYKLNNRDKVLNLVKSFEVPRVGGAVRIEWPEGKFTTLVFEDWSACMRCCDCLKNLGCFDCVQEMSCVSACPQHDGNSVITIRWKQV